MKSRFVIGGFLLVVLLGRSTAGVIRQHVEFARADLSIVSVDGQASVDLKGCEPTDEVGAPQLVCRTVFVRLPAQARVLAVNLVRADEQELDGEQIPAPVQPQVITMEGVKPRRVAQNPAVYAGEQPYPADVIAFAGQGNQGRERLAMVTVFPVRYRPARHRLTFVRDVEFEIVYELTGAPVPEPSRTSSRFEYMIVTTAGMAPAFQRLADWKTQKGVTAVTRDIAGILANYPGRDDAERLRNYLKTCYPDSGLKWLLLGGDVGMVPLRYAFAMSCSAHLLEREDSLPCDLYYSDLDGDWDGNGNNLFGEVADSVDLMPELFVGRAPVNDSVQARVFVDKVLSYERSPVPELATRAVFAAEILWQDPYTDQARAKNYIDDEFLPPRIDPVAKLYQSQGTENLDTTLAELNRGFGFFNHDGHAGYNAMSVGGWPNYLNRDHMDSLRNAPAYGICYSIGCWAAAFDLDAVAERFVRAANGGGVAFIGNSSYGWGSPGNPRFGYSDRFDIEFYRQLFGEGTVSLGEALARDKLHFVPYSREANVYRWHQYEVNLLGDPEMPVWTSRPQGMVIAAPANLPLAGTRLPVSVRDSAGHAVENARVCAMKGSETYAVGRTGVAGQVVLSVVPATPGEVVLTAGAPNFRPVSIAIPIVSGAYVGAQRFAIRDSLGNGDGIANPGEDVLCGVWFRNDGDAAAPGLGAKLRYAGTLLAVSDSVAVLPDLNPGDSARGEFRFQVSPDARDRDVADLDLVVSDNGGHSWGSQPAVLIGAPRLQLAGAAFTDSAPGGNGNGVFEPGEELKLTLRLRNAGQGTGHDAHASISVLDSTLTVIAQTTMFGDIGSESLAIARFPLAVLVRTSCPVPHVAKLLLTMSSEGYFDWDTAIVMVGDNGLTEDFESGAPGWTTGGTGNLWHLSSRRSHSPVTSFYCGDDGTGRYRSGIDCWVRSGPIVAGPDAGLSFWRTFEVPIYGADGLYVIVEHESVGVLSADTLDYIGTGGALRRQGHDSNSPANSGTYSEQRDAISSDWQEEHYPLNRYEPGETLWVRFGFKSDGDTNTGEGFYIDDVRVGTSAGTFESQFRPEMPSELKLRSAFPNPFTRLTTVVYQLPLAARVSLKVYALDGRQVATLVNRSQNPGYYPAVWAGTDDRGRNAASGVYVCELVVRDAGRTERRTGRVVLTR